MSATQVPEIPRPISAGAEMAALRRFFRACSWNGTIVEGAMGPGTPEMTPVSTAAPTPTTMAMPAS